MRRSAAALAAVALLGGCSLFRRSPAVPPASPHYVVGGGYQQNGTWYYPREVTAFAEAGLATVIPDHAGLTADGERFDATAMAASHHTLQLPAILRVTNMDNGRSALVRVNDRGPAAPGRTLGLTARAATLLGVVDGTRVRLELDGAASRSVAEALGGGPRVQIAAAPRDAVQAEALPPPPGRGQAGAVRPLAGATRATADSAAGPAVPDRLPEQVIQGAPEPGRIWLRASEFGRIDYAQREAAQLAALRPEVQTSRDSRSPRFAVRAGPFSDAAAATAALDQARRAGVIDARIVVE